MKSLVIFGAGGHGRVVADVAKLNGYNNIVFLDDANVSVASGKVSEYSKYSNNSDFFVAIGDNNIRKKIQNKLEDNKCNIISLIHPQAVIGSNVSIGKGVVIMAGVVINVGARIGNGTILNTCCSVDHDCIIDDFCHISVGSHIAGNVAVGKGSFVCAGATVINNIKICDECVIGAGAVVIKNIDNSGTYVGVPAREIE